MKLRRLQIENFRGLKNLELEFNDTTVLIGENNTGKTAVLDAIKFALREVRSRKGCAFDAYDFHLPHASAKPSSAPPIRLRLTFKEERPGEWGDERTGRLLRAKILQVDDDGFSRVILEVTGQFDAVTNDFTQGWDFLNLEGQPLQNLTESVLSQFQNEVSYHYLAALRDATRQFDAKGAFWRPFLKESTLTAEKRQEIEAMLAKVNGLIVASHESFSKVTTHLQDVDKVVPLAGKADSVSIDAVPARLFEILAKTQVNLGTGTGAKMPVVRHGEGTQSLAVLMLFRAFLEAVPQGLPIIALEEPEAHLHPSAVRTLWHLIEGIPGQKIISTHSGDLLAEAPSETVVRLHRKNGNVSSRRLAQAGLEERQLRQFNFHIRHARGELLFARCWILGEGETEVTLIPELARILGKDLERVGVRCIAYRQSDIELYLKVADCFDINWVAICDNDQQGVKDQNKAKGFLNGRIESDTLFVMPEPDIEQHLCAAGFGPIYESFLSSQTRANVTVSGGDPMYWAQVTKAVHRHKTAAIPLILDKIRAGDIAVPPLLERVIKEAIKLSEGV
ncbi:MAG TPA: DUF2813 domain-containing protein [Blastocatellia bacterium]|nr:DUF2813 domain-containing protein [Blastocatellia bacterium]HMY71828.1 DUF2813 domain-containing protein [Blastocatellia bacterium]HMZ17136.1 DUF2813 domain-containing protein [Blastocatellia bacterium]